MEQRNAFEVIAETLSMSEELADLRAKLAAAQAELDDLRISVWQARNETVALWYSIPDNQPLRSVGADGEFVEVWTDGGKLIMEDEREFRLEYPIGNTVALCRMGNNETGEGIVSLVERLLDEARANEFDYVTRADGPSRRWLVQRLREQLGATNAAT